MISSLEIEATLRSAKAAISPRVRRLTLSSLNTFWLGAALSGSPCFADLPAEVATVLLKTVAAVVAAAVMEDIVAVLLLFWMLLPVSTWLLFYYAAAVLAMECHL